MAQGLAPIDPIAIAAALLADRDDPGFLHVADDFLNGSLRYPDIGGHIAEAGLPVTGQANQYMTVVAEEGPITHHRLLKRRYP